MPFLLRAEIMINNYHEDNREDCLPDRLPVRHLFATNDIGLGKQIVEGLFAFGETGHGILNEGKKTRDEQSYHRAGGGRVWGIESSFKNECQANTEKKWE